MRPCRWLPRREICIPREETCSRASACTFRSPRAASFPRPSVLVGKIHPSTSRGRGVTKRASSMALRAYECGSCLHTVPCWEDLAQIGCRSPRRSTAPSPMGAMSDASKSASEADGENQTTVYNSTKVPIYRGSHHARGGSKRPKMSFKKPIPCGAALGVTKFTDRSWPNAEMPGLDALSGRRR